MSAFIRRIVKVLIFSIVSLSSFYADAAPSPFMVLTSPYLGLDVENRYITWESNLGSNVFKKNYPQAKVYGGLRFCDYVGVELGYETTTSRTVKNMLPQGAIYLGQPVGSGPTLVEGTFEIGGPYAQILGFIPIFFCDDNLYLSIGAANLKASHEAYILGDGGIGVINPAASVLRFSQRKTVLRVGAGLEHFFWDCLGLRLNVAWENTKKFGTFTPQNNPNGTRRVSLRDSWIYGVGLFYQF